MSIHQRSRILCLRGLVREAPGAAGARAIVIQPDSDCACPVTYQVSEHGLGAELRYFVGDHLTVKGSLARGRGGSRMLNVSSYGIIMHARQ